MFSTQASWLEMIIALAAIITVGAIAWLIRWLLPKYRRPNGKKGGIISFNAAVAFAVVTVTAFLTQDWFITGLTVVLAYLLGRCQIEDRQHYLYQVTAGAILGVLIPLGFFYLYHKGIGINGGTYERETYNDMPEKARDDREEADEEAPELRLEDLNEMFEKELND